jgi:hypothetical protein
MTWPPPRVAEPEVDPRPWDPRHPRARHLVKEHDRLVYVVVDEIVDGWVGLSVSPWPHADDEGRLRFCDPDGAVDVGTSVQALQVFLKPEDPESIEPRVGHTYAARAKERAAAALLDDLRRRAGHGEARLAHLDEFIVDPVDLTEHGRRLAKLACYGAMLSAVPSKTAKKWKMDEEIEP